MNNKFKYGLIILVVGIVLMFIAGPNAISFLKSPKELKEISDFDIADSIKKGDHVIIDVKATLGNAVSYVTYDKKTGKTSSEDNRYYILPFGNEEGSIFLTVKVPNKDFKGFEAAEDFFYNPSEDFTETFVTVEGVVRDLTSEENNYVKEFGEEFDSYMGTNISYYLSSLCVDTKNKTATIVMAIGGVVMALVGILLFVLGLKQGSVQKANRQALVNANYYAAPQNVTFNNDPNAPAQPQAPPQSYDPYSIANDPRFANVQQNAANAQAHTIPNDVPAVPDPVEITPITPLSPIEPINNGDQTNT
ncbi:MAG: hypothetical protein K5795_04070 [Lachnospiraceae bacterium]|nr:hypothetical protein [Lachnospiraceae bacterium]